jgi:60 kDa SS-A/Ro ribonucleoprotein
MPHYLSCFVTNEAEAANAVEANAVEANAVEANAIASTETNDFVHMISLKDYILRALILGTTKNTYCSVADKNDNSAIEYIKKQIWEGNGQEILAIVKEVYRTGRAPKQDMTLMTHALLCRSSDTSLRQNALAFLLEYRTLSQLYAWKNFHARIPNEEDGSVSKGFGRAVKRNLNAWIVNQSPETLAYQSTKYQSRGNWAFTHFLKCAHPKSGTGDDRATAFAATTSRKIKTTKVATPLDLVLRYAIDGFEKMDALAEKFALKEDKTYHYLKAIQQAKTYTNEDDLIRCIRAFSLTREQIPSQALSSLNVQTALLVDEHKTKVTMPLGALLRNLANLTRLGVFDDAAILDLVLAHLTNADIIAKARIHPVNVLTAWFTYRQGRGKKSKHTWTPQTSIVEVLEQMFYLSFKNVKPTGKRLCFLIDGSGSMMNESLCEGVNNAEAAALLAMVFTRAEANSPNPVDHAFYIFSSGEGEKGLIDVSDLIHAEATFAEVLCAVQRSDWGRTDISKGILRAMQFKRLFDGFVVITDNDVNSGSKPSLALKQYRQAMKIDSKLAVVATQISELSIADPADKGMMDFCGFDSYGPKLLQEFFAGITTTDVAGEDID